MVAYIQKEVRETLEALAELPKSVPENRLQELKEVPEAG